MPTLISAFIVLLAPAFLSLQNPSIHNHSYLHSQQLYTAFGDEFDNGYKKSRFDSVLDKVIEIYTPIVKKAGGSFRIERDWYDGSVNMWAWRWGNDFWLEIPGGMARYYLINEEAFLLSVCHELGHLLGGSPYKSSKGKISLEGQSDYYATNSCIEKVLTEIESENETLAAPGSMFFCKNQDRLEYATCLRATSGALSLSSYYAKLEKVVFPKIETASKRKVDETLKVHPPAQCRLDTFIAGLTQSHRPRCWFKD